MIIREASIGSSAAQRLIEQLDKELRDEYLPTEMHPVDCDSFHRNGGIFAIAYDEDEAIGCGALRPVDETTIELKRMYVAEARRRRGVARRILEYLESKARQLSYQRLLLETGDAQLAAIRLYENSGFHRIDPFGEYTESPRSVCFVKSLQDEAELNNRQVN